MLGYGYGSYVATQAIATLRERTSTQPTSQDFF
jgi:alpha/beta superfamily hydrolase